MKRTIMLAVPTIMLVTAVLLGGPTISAAHAQTSTFTDVSEANPAFTAIESLATRSIMSGNPSGEFLPNALLSRGEAAMALVKWRGQQGAATATSFPDVDGAYRPFVSAALASGWITGYPDGNFRPDQPLTREQLITVVLRSLNMQEQASSLTAAQIKSALAPFSDVAAVSENARPFIALALRNKLLTGDQGRLSPLNSITRAQFSMVLYRSENPLQAVSQNPPDSAGDTPGIKALSAQDQAKADFMTTDMFQPHNSPITGEMVLQNADWYGIPALPQLVIMAAETSLGDPRLGGTLARHFNFGCMRYHGGATAWGALASGKVWAAGKDWFSFPDAATGMAAFGRYLKAGVNGYYLPILRQDHPDWERFAAVYYGRGVSGFSAYVGRLRTLERSFRSAAAARGVTL